MPGVAAQVGGVAGEVDDLRQRVEDLEREVRFLSRFLSVSIPILPFVSCYI